MKSGGIIFTGLVIMSFALAHLLSFAWGAMLFGIGFFLMGLAKLLWEIEL